MNGHDLDGERSGVKSARSLTCVSFSHRDLRQFKTIILSTRSVSNKTCPRIMKT